MTRSARQVFPYEDGTTFLLKQSQQLCHMFFSRAEIDWVDAKPGLTLELGCRHPETPALLDSLGHLRMQSLRRRVIQVCSFEADADCGHRRTASRLKCRFILDKSIEVFRLPHVVVDPVSYLTSAVSLEAHPYLQTAKSS